MTTEQRQELAIITEEAVNDGDIEKLRMIWKIIQDDEKSNPLITMNGSEWFLIIVPIEFQESIFNQ
jgi:hypothetical protein